MVRSWTPRDNLLKDNAVYTSSNEMPTFVTEKPVLTRPYGEFPAGAGLADEAAQAAVHRTCWRNQFLDWLRTGRAAVRRASRTETPPR